MMNSDPFEIIDALEQLAAKSTNLLGKCFINEDNFFVTITRLKSAMPDALKTLSSTYEGRLDSFYLIDELENLIETSPSLPLTAIKIFEPQQYHSLLRQLREALISDQQKAVEPIATNSSTPDTTVRDARAEAERIIQDARAEAERILAEARQQAGQIRSGPSLTLPESFPDTPNRL